MLKQKQVQLLKQLAFIGKKYKSCLITQWLSGNTNSNQTGDISKDQNLSWKTTLQSTKYWNVSL